MELFFKMQFVKNFLVSVFIVFIFGVFVTVFMRVLSLKLFYCISYALKVFKYDTWILRDSNHQKV